MPKSNLDELYLQQLNKQELLVYNIANAHLGSSFNMRESIGFQQWKEKYEKS